MQNVKCSHRSIIRTGDTTRWRKWYTGDYARVMDSKAGTFGTSTSPKPVIENEQTKILWDFSIQTDHSIEANRPDIVVLEKTSRKCLLIDIACPFDTRVANKEREKIEKYQDLRKELQRIWKCSDVKIIPVIIGALGTLPKCLPKWLRVLNMTCDIELLQKVCLLGSARILRRVLDM